MPKDFNGKELTADDWFEMEAALAAKDKQIAELEKDRARLERGLRNCLLFASKMSNNKKPWARSIRGLCADAGVTPNPLRTATLAQQGEASATE